MAIDYELLQAVNNRRLREERAYRCSFVAMVKDDSGADGALVNCAADMRADKRWTARAYDLVGAACRGHAQQLFYALDGKVEGLANVYFDAVAGEFEAR